MKAIFHDLFAFQTFVTLFRRVYFLAFFNSALDDFKKQRDLLVQSGAFDGVMMGFLAAHNATYDSTTFVSEVLGILATLVWRGKRNAVRAARFVGLMCDEATDCSTKGKVLVYYRYADLLGKFLS